MNIDVKTLLRFIPIIIITAYLMDRSATVNHDHL